MKTIEVEVFWASEEDENLDKLEELGIKVNDSERKEETGLCTINVRNIVAFNDTTNPDRTRLWIKGELGTLLVNMPYKEFKELYHSTEAKDEII